MSSSNDDRFKGCEYCDGMHNESECPNNPANLASNKDNPTWDSGCEVCENCKQGKVCIERTKEDKYCLIYHSNKAPYCDKCFNCRSMTSPLNDKLPSNKVKKFPEYEFWIGNKVYLTLLDNGFNSDEATELSGEIGDVINPVILARAEVFRDDAIIDDAINNLKIDPKDWIVVVWSMVSDDYCAIQLYSPSTNKTMKWNGKTAQYKEQSNAK